MLTDKIDAEVFDAVKSVKGVANYAVGYDNIDVPEATKRGIGVKYAWRAYRRDCGNGLGFVVCRLSPCGRIGRRDAIGQWQGWGPLQFIGGDVTGATLGIVGAVVSVQPWLWKSKDFR